MSTGATNEAPPRWGLVRGSSDLHIQREYCPHIDGIRALAVLPVVMFHLLAALCPGGFAGVDVFFVISGYLITGGILRDLENGHFTVRGFYHRRIRRIIPAYFGLVAGVFIIGCAVYYCVPLRELADASVAGTLFSANLYSWVQNGDYFAPNAHEKPLMHLWSLSVEEQFYLLIPLLCATLWKFRRHWVAPVLATIAVLSFSSAVHAIATGRQNSAYFLTQYRAWELLAGSLLALLPVWREPRAAFAAAGSPAKRNGAFQPGWTSRQALLAAAGLLMVLSPYAWLSSTTPFPGVAALSSVLGAALLLRYGQTGWINHLLSWRPFVFTGKISYSLYLWHWPVMVFWRYVAYDQLSVWDYVGMLLLSFLLAYLSWRFVEKPVRTSPAWTRRRSFAFAAAGIALLVSIGLACSLTGGWPGTLHPQANALDAEINTSAPSFMKSLVRQTCRKFRLLPAGDAYTVEVYDWAFRCGNDGPYHIGAPEEPEILIVGDSHSGSLRPGLDLSLRERHRAGYAISRSGARMYDLSSAECQESLAAMRKYASISKVVLVEYWTTHADRESLGNQKLFGLLADYAALVQSMGKTLFVVTDVPHYLSPPET